MPLAMRWPLLVTETLDAARWTTSCLMHGRRPVVADSTMQPVQAPHCNWRNLAAILATCAGITEADVRDWKESMTSDIYIVRAWNHRRYRIARFDAYQKSGRRG